MAAHSPHSFSPMRSHVFIAALVAYANAAPLVLTRTHTAAPVVEWVTHTTNTAYTTNVIIKTINGPPPNEVPATAEATPTSAPEPPATSTTLATQLVSTVTPATLDAAAPAETTPTTPAEATTQPTTPETSPTAATPETPATSAAPVPTTSTTPVPTTSTSPVPTTSTNPAPTTPTTPSAASTTSTIVATPTTSTTPFPTSPSTSTTPNPTKPPSTSTSTSATPSPTSSLNSFESQILEEHNTKRALHGVQPLSWDPALAQWAADYAAKAFSCDNVQLIHSGGPYGENLAAGYVGGAAPVDAWYNEIKDYNFNSPGFSEATGHFTQVVWKSTSTIGCAKVTCSNEWRQYTICEYSKQRGNIVGTDLATGKSFFEENVLPPV